MPLSRDQVRHVAMLARLGLSDGEEEFYADQLSGILDAIGKLAEVDVEAIEPTAQVVEVRTVLADDVPRPCLTPEQALANAPAARDGLFVVRAILDQED